MEANRIYVSVFKIGRGQMINITKLGLLGSEGINLVCYMPTFGCRIPKKEMLLFRDFRICTISV